MADRKRVILAFIEYGRAEDEHYIEECRELCRAAGAEVVGIISQRSRKADPHTGFRSGKVSELITMCQELKADQVIFCSDLPPAVISRLNTMMKPEVLDRTSLILLIFEQRARSRQAKLQVEIASLKHTLSSYESEHEARSHERGGTAMNRGAGEMRSTSVHRHTEARIRDLQKDLKRISDRENEAEDRRKRNIIRRAAIVGYTNAGKSSLLNAVLRHTGIEERRVEEKDMLFATLDTSVRRIRCRSREFLLYDTVGFVSRLPHELVEAFNTTLSAAAQANLLINVTDASDPMYREKKEITLATMQQIGAGDIPVLSVYNKIDLVKEREEYPGIAVSCLTGEGLDTLLEQITEMLYPAEVVMNCHIPYDRIGMLDRGRNTLRITVLDRDETGMYVKISGPRDFVRIFRPWMINEERITQ